jgi:PPOX class probable F420-dependent enzyme
MLDFNDRFGRHANRRLREEKVIWLTTVDPANAPQPRPVWFHWDGSTLLIFSEPNKAKLRHIASNSRVAINFNTDEDGGDVIVLIGDAVVPGEFPPSRLTLYLRKYGTRIEGLGMTREQFKSSYSVPILVTPKSMRGFL